MTSPNYISRADALAFIVEQRSKEIISAAQTQSVAMSTFRQINMGSSSLKMPLLETFPDAQWLVATPPADPDIVVKPNTTMSWGTQDLVAEEAATIVLIPENVIDDAEYDLWGEVESRTAEAIARLIDQTCFFGTAPVGAIPASFPVGGIHGRAVAAGHEHVPPATGEDIAESWNQTMALVEADGYDVSRAYSGRGIRSQLRGLRDANGQLIYATNLQGGTAVDAVYGVPLTYVTNGAWNPAEAQAIVGDPQMAVLGIRQRLTAKQLAEATINGVNLAEQDMLGLRVKIRLGFTILAPKQLGQSANPFPFAVLAPKAP